MQNYNELPNLNFGLQVKQLQCSIHPTIVSNILDHYMRRPTGENTVVGTLLGSVDGQLVEMQSCFSVPIDHEDDGSLSVDMEYQTKMLKFHRKVNPKEGLIGLYISGQSIDSTAVHLFQYYQSISRDKKNKSPLTG